MKRVIRYSLGVFLLLMGINKFVSFLPAMDMSNEASNFMTALVETGYMLPMVGVVEIVSGILLFSVASTPFALLILAPLSVNIVLFHLALDPSTIFFAGAVFLANVYLGVRYFDYYRPIFVKILGEKVIIRDKQRNINLPVAEVS